MIVLPRRMSTAIVRLTDLSVPRNGTARYRTRARSRSLWIALSTRRRQWTSSYGSTAVLDDAFSHVLSAGLAFAAFAVLWSERERAPRTALLSRLGCS